MTPNSRPIRVDRLLRSASTSSHARSRWGAAPAGPSVNDAGMDSNQRGRRGGGGSGGSGGSGGGGAGGGSASLRQRGDGGAAVAM